MTSSETGMPESARGIGERLRQTRIRAGLTPSEVGSQLKMPTYAIEALERDYPLRVTRYEFAPGTGGAGRYRGGNGLIRAIEFVEGSAHASLLADRHTLAPPGACGGEAGACGRHALIRDGVETAVAAKASFALAPNDVLIVQTPGGGGYGPKPS